MEAAEIVTIVGPNGSGKSTLLRALFGEGTGGTMALYAHHHAHSHAVTEAAE